MNKRSDTIRNLFATTHGNLLSADNNTAAVPRVSSGSVRSVKESFSGIERENEKLRAQITNGTSIIELDPNLIDPSPVADRIFDTDETSYSLLKQSIRENGQEVPVLVRTNPTSPQRYQSAYGHRRVRAALELGVLVKAVVRQLSDDELVVAQGVENSARSDLSFIERARFALRLEEAGHSRAVIQSALSIDRAEASKLVSVARGIPHDLVGAIGRAAKVGRGRWQSLSDMLAKYGNFDQVREVVAADGFSERDSDSRFAVVFEAASVSSEAPGRTLGGPSNIVSTGGRQIATAAGSEKELRLTINKSGNVGFADYLVNRLPEIFDAYMLEHPEEGTSIA